MRTGDWSSSLTGKDDLGRFMTVWNDLETIINIYYIKTKHDKNILKKRLSENNTKFGKYSRKYNILWLIFINGGASYKFENFECPERFIFFNI